jgi:hypothetical protein
VLLPLLRLGRAAEAAEYHRRGYRLTKDKLDFVEQISDHLIYLVLIQNTGAAIKLFERHLGLVLSAPSPLNRYRFFRASLFLFRQLQKGSRARRKFRLPNTFPLWAEEGTYTLARLADWFEAEARTLAQQFDARSSNTYRMRELDQLSELENLIQPVDNQANPPADDSHDS